MNSIIKRNIFTLTAIVLGISLSALTITKPRCTIIYFVYKGFGMEKSMSSYDVSQTQPPECDGIDVVCWFRCCVADPNNPTVSEFNDCFEAVDGDYGGSDDDQLSDELSEDHNNFEKRN
jgi:hypothetical protein